MVTDRAHAVHLAPAQAPDLHLYQGHGIGYPSHTPGVAGTPGPRPGPPQDLVQTAPERSTTFTPDISDIWIGDRSGQGQGDFYARGVRAGSKAGKET